MSDAPCSTANKPHGLLLPPRHKENILQGVSEELVKLGDLGRDAEVDGSVANLHNESSNNFRVHLSQSS